ncbi:hypothetical protein PIB30_004059 [Stylosanthes scabra]|uniref:Uncharacterized protein n=1 Tax=Stylosanthes scabra TaxID=79078 RepID=A0ABU6Y1Q5_9FABA|nr:hypothetical protein [Stylosanthes scabra]
MEKPTTNAKWRYWYLLKRLNTYWLKVSVVSESVKYGSFVIGGDEDLQVLFYYRKQFPEVMMIELFAKLKDLITSSSGSVLNQALDGLRVGSSLMNLVALVLALPASLTFDVNWTMIMTMMGPILGIINHFKSLQGQ